MRILIIEDEPKVAGFLKQGLEESGYEVLNAYDGPTGRQLALQEPVDLVLMDVVMPGMNGYQATRTITRDEATRDIPVIMCTSKGQETDKIWGMRQGANDYLVKPIDVSALLAKIAALG